jgi:hypothetical protein
VVDVPGAGTLHEGDVLGFLAVGGAGDLAARGSIRGGQSLHHHVGDHVRKLSEPQVVELGGVIGAPTRGHDDGPHLDLDLFVRHVQIDRPGRQDLRQLLGVGFGHPIEVEDPTGRVPRTGGPVQHLGLVHPEVEVVGEGDLVRHRLVQQVLSRHVPGPDPYPGLQVVQITGDLLHRGQRIGGDSGVLPQPADVDLEPAGRRTHLWEVPVRT